MDVVDHADYRLIRLVGRLSAKQVHALLEAARGGGRSLHLNLSELMSVDAVGLEALHVLRHDGAQLFQVPTYIQLKLDALASKRRKSLE